MSEIVNFPIDASSKVELGPKSAGHSVFVEGRVIPGLRALDHGEEVEFILDDRFSYIVPANLSLLFASAMAQSMAIGAGYSHLGAESRDRSFAPKAFKLGD